MTDQTSWTTEQRLHQTAPPSHQAVKFLTAASIGSTLVVLSGLTLTGTVMALVLATPLLVLFSPILVPAAIVVVLATIGFVVSVGFGVAALTALSWIYKYATGEQPAGAEQLDYARMKIASKVKECGQYVQHMAHDATHYNEGPHRQHQGYAYSS